MNRSPYWMPRLCRLVEAAEQAEERRAAARTTPALNAAEADLDAALLELQRYYARLPYQIPLTSGVLERMARLAAVWLRRVPPGAR